MIKNTYILIPSRIGSTRLKNKPLINLDGKSIIQRAISNALSITEKLKLPVLVGLHIKKMANFLLAKL